MLSQLVEDVESALPPVQQASDDFFVWNVKSDRVTGTPSLGDLFGVDDWNGGTLAELGVHVPNSDLVRLRERASEALRDATPFTFACSVRTRGEEYTVQIRCQPIQHPPSGEPVLVTRCVRQPADASTAAQ